MKGITLSLLLLLSIPAVLSCAYLLVMTLLSASPKALPRSRRVLRFEVIVPAHNESVVISGTLASLARIDWPSDRYRVVVVADNCTDDTASIARARGVDALERNDPSLRGKGYALQYAFRHCLEKGWSDALVIIDADAEVSSNLLEACAARIEAGALAVQVHYGILNPDAAWRTRLITIAKAAFHIARSRARELLGLSCGIRGNGWCVTHELLRRVPYAAFSLTEDVEYGIDLGLSGYRVFYADEAHSDAEMVSNEQAARKQRQRWEDGRFQLIRSKAPELFRRLLHKPDRICLDLLLDLIVLPLSYVAINLIAFLALAVLFVQLEFAGAIWIWLALSCLLAMLLYVLRGWQLSGTGLQGLLDLCRAPIFLVWKLVLMIRRREPTQWVRTERERP